MAARAHQESHRRLKFLIPDTRYLEEQRERRKHYEQDKANEQLRIMSGLYKQRATHHVCGRQSNKTKDR